MAEGNRITVADLPPEITRHLNNYPNNDSEITACTKSIAGSNSSLRDKLRRVEAELILGTIEECGGDRKAAADLLEIGLSSLYRKLQEYEEENFVEDRTKPLRK